MDLSRAQLSSSELTQRWGDISSYDQETSLSAVLGWIAENPYLACKVSESQLDLNETYYRFFIEGTDVKGNTYSGLGRSANRLTAAGIAAAELIERFAAKSVF